MGSQILRGFCTVANKGLVYIINTLPRFKYGSVISLLSVLAATKPHFGSVAQGALELYSFQFGRCDFLSDSAFLNVSSKKICL